MFIGSAAAVMVPAVLFKVLFGHQSPALDALIFGSAIVAGAFLLAWGAEAAQVEISAGLAIAAVALLTVLPEYAIDMTFAWKAGADPALPAFLAGDVVEPPDSLAFPAANLTGANRLLSGLGWPLVILLFWWRRRQGVRLTPALTPEIFVLGLAALYSTVIFVRGEIALWDSAVLIVLFGSYLWLISRTGAEGEEGLIGPPAMIAAFEKVPRRLIIAAMFIVPGIVIGISASPFADGLVDTGEQFGIDRFILVQWLAPLASEAPEILVAVIFTLRGNPVFGIAALISASANQWTLLVASLPVVFSLGLGEAHALPLDARQTAEVFLTMAQIVFAVTLVSKLRVGWVGAGVLFAIFVSHLFFSGTTERYIYGVIFLVLTGIMLIVQPVHAAGLRDRTTGFFRMFRERAEA